MNLTYATAKNYVHILMDRLNMTRTEIIYVVASSEAKAGGLNAEYLPVSTSGIDPATW